MARPRATTRRQFLQHAAALSAAPLVLTTTTRRAHAAPPSNRLTVGLIGVGNMGSGHLNGFLGDDALQLVAICDVDRTKRDAACQKVDEHYGNHTRSGRHAGCASIHEYEELLARPDIDAVLIATPDHWHAAIAIAACRAGKDVYCEKPLSLTVREAQAMTAAARRYATVFQTGSQQRSSAEFRHAVELVRNGYIGDVREVRVGIGEPSRYKYLPEQPIPAGFDWDRWLGPTPWYPYNAERCSGNYSGGWRYVRDTSGGMMTDWGAHHFDIGQWGLDRDGSGPVEVVPPMSSDDGLLHYIYADGVQMIRDPSANGVRFIGSDGVVEVNRGYLRTEPASLKDHRITPREQRVYRSDDHRQNWLECIRTRQRPICDVAVGASSVTVCHLGNIAWWLGRPIRWNPDTHEIINDGEAAAMLDRPRRAPYRLHA